jgi:two-component system, cell cycle sensor histidine kinase and response regulator CckA
VLAPRFWDLNVVVGEMEQMLRRLIGEDVELTWVPGPVPAYVRADRGRLEQILMNLAVNARDAMPDGGRLSIELSGVTLDGDLPRELSATGPGRYCVLSVSDSGHGMDADTRERIFEPFFTTKEPGKGTGLGLSTVYGIVKQGGGMISVVSQQGVGSTFTVHLPSCDEEAAPVPAPVRGATSTGSETVLLVEDEPGVRAIGRELLALNGYVVLEAADGVEALEVAGRHAGPIHLLLSDVVMPRMGGRELAGRIAAVRPGIRLLFISGFTDDTVVRHGVLDAGVPFLQKPFTLESLSLKVREVLDAPAPGPTQATHLH